MAIESPRPAKLGVDGYAEEATPAFVKREASSVKLRLRAPNFVEDAPEATPDSSGRPHWDQLLYGFSFEPEIALKRAQERLDEVRAGAEDPIEEAAVLLAMADALAAQEPASDYAEGPDSAYRLAAEVVRRMEDAGHIEGRAAARHVMAKAKLASGGCAEAVQEAQEALQLYRALGHLEGEAATLDVLAQAQLKEDPESALQSASSGCDLFRRLGDRRTAMLERTTVGARLACGQIAEALRDAEASVRRSRRDAGDRRDEAAALIILAEVHNRREAHHDVATAALSAAEIFGGGGNASDRRNQAAALHLAASAKLRCQAPQEALELAQRAKALSRSLREAAREVVARGLEVEAHIALGDHVQALAIASEKLEDLRQRQDHFSYSEGCRQRALALLATSEFEEAQLAARAAFNAASRLRGQKRVQSQASALEQLVEAQRLGGNFQAMTQAAEELVSCCREMVPQHPSREARALRLCTRGQLILRRPKQAIQSAGRAMSLFQELGDVASADEMRSLFARAQALREGMRAAAQDARQAWLLYREHGDTRLLFEAAKNCHDAYHKFDDRNVLLLEKL